MKYPRLRQKRHAFYFDTQAKPRKWIPLGSDEARALREYRRLMSNEASAGTIGQMLADHMAKLRTSAKLKPATIALYSAWQTHLHRVFRDVSPGELTQADILHYLDICPRTSGPGEISLLSAAYRTAMRQSPPRVTFNPCVGAKSERTRPKRTRHLLHGELVALYRHASPLLKVAMDLGYVTGLRESELCALRWDDFGIGEAVERSKKGPRARYTLTDDVRAILDEAKALQGRVACLTVLCERGQPVNRHRIKYLWNRACKAASVADANFHDLRAKAGTDADEQGADATKLLGHATEQTTKRYLRGRRIVPVEPLKRLKL